MMSLDILNPAQVRAGMQILHELAETRNRQDIATVCTTILSMDDRELSARQHEIAALRALGMSPIAHGYLESSIRTSE
tara:strand:- start:608 stop:841 length:234 start_codon:yes stop_codon:yes gene_type:complete